MKQSINGQLTNKKKQTLNILMFFNIEEWNPNKKRKILIVLDYINDGMLSIKNLNPIVTVLFIKGKTLKTSLVLLRNLILLFQKILDEILHTILIWKFQTNKNFNKMH